MQLPVVCAAAALLGGMPAESVAIELRPAPGTTLVKRFELESHGQIDSLRWGDRELVGALASSGLGVQASLGVSDHYLAVGTGRPLELLRDFDDLRTVWEGRERSEVPHALLYRSVRFSWEPDQESYAKDWDPQRRHARVPEEVWEDLDLRSLLPAGQVRVGERWHVPLGEIGAVLLPGGPIHRDKAIWEQWKLFELEQTLAPRSRHWFRNDEVECRLDALVEIDGRALACIAVTWEWWGWVDPVGAQRGEGWWGRFGLDAAVVEIGLEARGELLWDLAGGHFHAFELDAQFEAELHLDGGFGAIEVRASGEASWSAEARAP